MKGALVKEAKRPAASVPSASDPRQTLATAANPIPHHGVTVKTSRARAVVDAAVADAVAGAADAGKKAMTGRFPHGPTRINRSVAGPRAPEITTVLTSARMNGSMNRRIATAVP